MVTATAQVWNGSDFVPSDFVQKLTLYRTEGQHDVVSLKMNQGDNGGFAQLTGQPAILDINTGICRCVFHGYLDTAVPARRVGVIDSDVTIFGATSPLRNGHARAWIKMTPSQIALDVLAPYKLGLEIDAFADDIDFISQISGESDWQLLSRLAQLIGFSLTSDDVVVRMVDARAQEDRTPTMSYDTFTIAATARAGMSTNVVSFEVESTGTPQDQAYKDMFISGRDRWGQPFSYRPSFDTDETPSTTPDFTQVYDGTVTSLGDAMLEAQRVRRQARWTNKAKLVCHEFHENLRPGRCVLIIDYDGKYGGFWYVTDSRADFKVTDNLTTMEATLVRDTLNPIRKSAPARMPAARYPMARLTPEGWETDRHWEMVS
jgi:hypothetical protein